LKKLTRIQLTIGWIFIFFVVTGIFNCGVKAGIETLPEKETKLWEIGEEIINPARSWTCLTAIQEKSNEQGIVSFLGSPVEVAQNGNKKTLKYRYRKYYSGYKVWLATFPIPIVSKKNSTGCDVHLEKGKPVAATVYYKPSTYFSGCIKQNDPTVPTRAEGCYSNAKHFDMFLTEKQRKAITNQARRTR